ncbi:MAG: hypothetical protein O3C69_06455 [Chloroflexi bacterium]|nr:hypothetical protein [Chloroflexota bacterium]
MDRDSDMLWARLPKAQAAGLAGSGKAGASSAAGKIGKNGRCEQRPY